MTLSLKPCICAHPLIFPGSNKLIHDTMESGLLLLAGPPGVGKTIFCKESVLYSLKDGNAVVYMATEETPNSIVASMKRFGWDVSESVSNDLLRIVDVYSYRGRTDPETKYYVENPENLTHVTLTLDKAREGVSNLRFILDSITSLAMFVGPGTGQRLMQTIIQRLKASGTLGICVLDVGILDETFLNYLRFIFDGVIEMAVTEEKGRLKRIIRVFSFKAGKHDTSWHEFTISNKGVEIT